MPVAGWWRTNISSPSPDSRICRRQRRRCGWRRRDATLPIWMCGNGTSRRWTIRQVKLLRVDGDGPMGCAGMFPEFDEATARGTGRMSARTEPAGPNDDPCSISPEAGYRGLENQFYRVEVHNGGDALDAAAG